MMVHDYEFTQSYEPANDVVVEITAAGNPTEVFNFQVSGEDDDYYVARITWPGGAITPCIGVAPDPAPVRSLGSVPSPERSPNSCSNSGESIPGSRRACATV